MKRFAIGLVAAACAFTLAGCGTDAETQTENGSEQADGSPKPADAESAEAEERAASDPDDYSARVLSLEDLPDGFTLDEETEFGEKKEQSTNPFDSNESSSEDASTQTECIVGVIGGYSSDLDGVSTTRSFEQSGDSNALLVMTSLSRTERDANEILKDMRKTVDSCPESFAAGPVESSKVFEPSAHKGESFCTTAYDGAFNGQAKMVASDCYVAWAGELLTVHMMAVDAGTSLAVEDDAIDGVTENMTDDLLPKALKKAEMAANQK